MQLKTPVSKSGTSASTGADEVQILEENLTARRSVELSEQHAEVAAWSSGKVGEGGCDAFKDVRKVPKNVKPLTQGLKKKTAKKNKKESFMDSDVKVAKLTVRQAAIANAKSKNVGKKSEEIEDPSQAAKKKAIEDSRKRFAETLAKERPEVAFQVSPGVQLQVGPALQRSSCEEVQVE